MRQQETVMSNGAAAAAVLAAGIGSFALGLFTTLAEAIAPLKNALNFYNAAGPLSGKTTMAVLAWLVAWIVLHSMWRNRQVDFGKVFITTLILVALALVGTFPPFYEAFGR